jgi:ceramide glucosyltransferase
MTILSISLFTLIILGSLYGLFSLMCVLGFFRDHAASESYPAENTELPAVSILKAIKGLDPRCSENLSSFCHQDYPCYEVLFGFRDQDDPAIPVVRSVAGSAACEGRVIIKNVGSGANQKVLNLQALADNAHYSLLALSDSDMEVDGRYLRRIVGESQGGGKTGIVTSLYKISNPLSVGSALESLTIALDFIPSVLVARRTEGVTFGLGASILVSKEALKEIGGFESIADYLADDYQMGYRLWRAGYNNVISRYVIENRVGRMSVADHLSHQLRWARTYRASRPWGFLGYGITHAFTYAVILFCIMPGRASVLTAVLVLALRYVLALVLYRKVICTKKWLASLALLPVKDILSFFVWLWSFAGSKVFWRGIRYRISADGRIVKV